MKWIFLILAMVGLFYLILQFAPGLIFSVAFKVPVVNLAISWSMIIFWGLFFLGCMKLKFGK